MEKFMLRAFICCLSIMVILGINCLIIDFNLVTLGLLLIDILMLYFAVSEQRLKKKIEDISKEEVTHQFVKDIAKGEREKKKLEEKEEKEKKKEYFAEVIDKFTKSYEGFRYVELPDYGDKKVFIFIRDYFKFEYITEIGYDYLDQAKYFKEYFSTDSEEKYNLYFQERKMICSDGTKIDLYWISKPIPSIQRNENSIVFDFRR